MYKSMISTKALRISIVAGALLALAGCSDSDSPTEEIVDTTMVSFAVSADAGQEVPPNPSTGMATGTLTLDQTSGALTGSVMVTDTMATAAHIHTGSAGVNGDVLITLDLDGTTISVPEMTMLTADQMQSMLDGDFYLNIHSVAYTSGELRDQLTGPGVQVIQVMLSGDNEVPPVTSQGSGTGYVTLNTTTGAMQVQVLTTGITTPNAAHVHTGLADANGDVLFPLTQDESEIGNFSGSDTLDTAGIATAVAGGLYLNVHSAENTSGELRGQITP